MAKVVLVVSIIILIVIWSVPWRGVIGTTVAILTNNRALELLQEILPNIILGERVRGGVLVDCCTCANFP
jgi:hypothetical protein